MKIVVAAAVGMGCDFAVAFTDDRWDLPREGCGAVKD
jgi:hypothetical protein